MGIDFFTILKYMGISLGLTLVLELIFAFVFRIRSKKDILLVCLVNILTNPAVVWFYNLAVMRTKWNQNIVIILLELMAFLTEALLYRAYAQRIRRPLLFSFGANTFSYFIGELIEMLL